jgi:hypothetical protein
VANADTWHDHRLGTDPDIASDIRGVGGFECIAGVGRLVRLAALSNPGMRGIATLPGCAPHSNEEAIVAKAECLIRLGLLQQSKEAA